MSINKVVVTGNLTRDAELRHTQSGLAISNISIAVNEKIKNSSTGEWTDYANFFNCTLFGKRAESLDPYLKKGQKVAIDGKLHFSAWTTDDNQKRNKVEIIVNDLELLGGKKADNAQVPAATDVPPSYEDLAPEDIPF